MFLKPTRNNVLIKQISKENETPSGIYIPERVVNDEKNLIGEIVAKGSDANEVSIGQNAIYSSYHGRKINSDGDEYVVITEDKILAVF